jgi:hypothetical protein
MTAPITRETFGGMLDRAGLTLTDAQKAVLFEAYPLLQKMIARAKPDMPREDEPSLIFTPEVR